jgi:hypothetical protein
LWEPWSIASGSLWIYQCILSAAYGLPPGKNSGEGFSRPGLLAFLNARPNLNQVRAEEEEKRCQGKKILLIHVALSAYHIIANYLNGSLLRTNPD